MTSLDAFVQAGHEVILQCEVDAAAQKVGAQTLNLNAPRSLDYLRE